MNEFMTGITRLHAPPPEMELLIHGTTVAVNTLVQLRGAKTERLPRRARTAAVCEQEDRRHVDHLAVHAAAKHAGRHYRHRRRPGQLSLRSAVPDPWKNMELTEDSK